MPASGAGQSLSPDFVDFGFEVSTHHGRSVANELKVIGFARRRAVKDEFNRIDFKEVQRIAGTCVTGCAIDRDRSTNVRV
jgi:hypothetical protein